MESRKTHRDIFKGRWRTYTDKEIETYISKGLFHNLTACDLLDRNVINFGDKLAIADESKEVTWNQLKERSNRLAIHLLNLGIGYGDFFLLQMPNIAEFMYLYFALNRIGAIPVMSLPLHRRLEIEHQVRTHEARGICVPVGEKFDYLSMANEIRAVHEHFNIMLTVGGTAPDGAVALESLLSPDVDPNRLSEYLVKFRPVPTDICTEQLSGGTTGAPKGIPRTHNDYICGWDYVGRAAGYTDESVAIVAIPIAHNASLENICGPAIFRGRPIVLCKSPTAENIFRLIEKYKVTHTLIVPVLFNYIKDSYQPAKYDLSSFKSIAVGGQKCRPEIIQWANEVLGAHVINTFGMAEGPQLTTRWHNSKEVQMYSVGRPVVQGADLEIKLVDMDNLEVSPGGIGEMTMKGPLNFRGYFNDEAENQRAFDKEGFFHTGDLMSMNPDGRYVVEGRSKDTILRGGENVYPERVEDLAKEHEGVFNCVAIGMPDERLGEKLCLVVETAGAKSITLDEIVRYLKERGLAVFQLPERLEVLEAIPLTAVKKVDKRSLRAYVTARLYKEGAITKEFGDEYLRRDKLSIDQVMS